MGVFFFYTEEGIEPIAVQQSGGLLLTPVQTLVATLISAKRKCKSTPVPVSDLFISRQEAQTHRSAAVRYLISRNQTSIIPLDKSRFIDRKPSPGGAAERSEFKIYMLASGKLTFSKVPRRGG